MLDGKIPRLHAYDSAIIEFTYRWSRLAYIYTYREVRARIMHLSGNHGYRIFAGWRDWQRKIRRSRRAP